MSGSMRRGLAGAMLVWQERLPRLPVPDLAQSLHRYVAAITPLVTQEKLEHTKALVAEFGKPGGVGEYLQGQLQERARTRRSWLADWWLLHNFLADRSSILQHSGCGLHPIRFRPRTKDMQLQVASRLLYLLLEAKDHIDSRSLVVQEFNKAPQCVELFFNLFGTCRQPAVPHDKLHRYVQDQTQHVIVAHNGQLFKLPVYHRSGRHLSMEEIMVQLQFIVQASSKEFRPPRDEQVSLLTAEQRDTWAAAFTELCQADQQNVQSLEAVQSAAVYLALDGGFPELLSPNSTDSEVPYEYDALFIKRLLTGGGVELDSVNRWHDKSMQFAVSEDGTVGGVMEHSALDGTASLAIQNHIIREFRRDLQKENALDEDSLPSFQRIEWKLTPSLRQMILKAGDAIDRKVSRLSISTGKSQKLGRKTVKQYTNADSFFQIAVQLAYYRMHGRTPPTHESCSTRKFMSGRTETIRSASVESDQFVRVVDDAAVAVNQKAWMMRQALDIHLKTAFEAASGQGFDRHLFGLHQMAVDSGVPVPEIFTDHTYTESRRFVLYTSQVATSQGLRLGFAPFRSVTDGYGVGYALESDQVTFTVTSYNDSDHTDSAQFLRALQKSLSDMKELLPHMARHPSNL